MFAETPTDFAFFDEPFDFFSLDPTTPVSSKKNTLSIDTQQIVLGTPAILVSGTSKQATNELDNTFQSLMYDFQPSPSGEVKTDLFSSFFEVQNAHLDDSSTDSNDMSSVNDEDEDQSTQKRKKIIASKKKKDSTPVSTSERVWKTIHVDESAGNLDTQVLLKTRRDKPSEYLPEKMYSSLKYEIIQKASGNFLTTVPLLLCRATVVDAETNKEIKLAKPVLKGNIESALTKDPTSKNADEFECKMKIQFDYSYHQEKKLVALELKFYLNDKLDNPILIKRSCPLKVYARKPNKTKRMREEAKELKSKKIKEAQEKEFNDFTSQLDKCFELAHKFADEEKKIAMQTIINKFAKCFGSDAIVMANQPSTFTDSSSESGDFF
ncbi:predicted protein [Naegleria gruberi]|uniref:Predicted protein n=1 Tax=Naegleria gruberi TaxID=5762 RepID=D2UY56_NAEGR|nr:uncharacterized protein NAEGRDRAFT_45095 [Naegleria gruberi]EFC50733.1 predicted protein [Naegleria gruberi]|eukprot:XP_002683477.1 predicted protein [Naegleria gruberi strain NEG-M]